MYIIETILSHNFKKEPMRTVIITLFLISLMGLPSVAQFQVCESPTTKWLQDVYFVDSEIGVAVGDSGIIIRSVDGGNHWDIVLNIDTISSADVVKKS